MNLKQQITEKEPEGIRLEYTSKEATSHKIARELVAMSNAEGGAIVIGIRDDESGRPDQLENVESTDDIARSASDVLYERVQPPLEFDTELVEIDGCTLLALSVTSSDQLRSYEHKRIEEPVFPIRRQTEVRYLSGSEVNEHYEEVFARQNRRDSDELLRLPDETLDSENDEYFIEAPDGHISEICIFSNLYYPGNPTRIRVSTDYIPEQKAEHIFASLETIFEISIGDANFTLNQENGAWVGKEYYNFVKNLRNRQERYRAVHESDYDLSLYGNEQAVLVADFGMVYPESTLIVYAAPFSSEDGYRHLTLNFFTDGQPVDVRPLIEFSERTNLDLYTSYKTGIHGEGFENPSRIPVDVVERTTRSGSWGDGASVDGAICENPFYDRENLLRSELDVDRPIPLANYRELYGFLRDCDDSDSPSEYESEALVVRDWNSFTEGVYANVKEVQFSINW